MSSLADPEVASEGVRLDKDQGIGSNRADERAKWACGRWPEGLWIVNTGTGEVCQGCCKATNLCECARRRYMRETTRMLALDAVEEPPVIFAVLTAREYLEKGDALKRLFSNHLLRPLRERWPVEWFLRWEEQGRGALHVNLLVKGVPVEEWQEFGRELVELWCRRVDAEPSGQYVEPIESGEAVTLYVAKKVAHAGKANQEPQGWRFKHRTSQTRGYLVRAASVMRQEARRSLAVDALVWAGAEVEEAELEVAACSWKIVADSRYQGEARWSDTGRRQVAPGQSRALSTALVDRDTSTGQRVPAAGSPSYEATAAGRAPGEELGS